MESGFASLSRPLWPGRGLSIFRIDRREVFALWRLRATWRIASGKLVKITDLERRRNDVRRRQRWWVLEK